MKGLRAQFNSIRTSSPFCSDYICFARLVDSRGLSKSTLTKWFNQLVDIEDWCVPGEVGSNPKSMLINALYHYTQTGHNQYPCSDTHKGIE